MENQNNAGKNDTINIYVARITDGAIKLKYTTGIKEYAYVPVSEAKRALERLGAGYELVTDDQDVAKEYCLNLMRIK